MARVKAVQKTRTMARVKAIKKTRTMATVKATKKTKDRNKDSLGLQDDQVGYWNRHADTEVMPNTGII